MTRPPGMSQALARSPGLFVSTVLTWMVGALLPPLPALTVFVCGLALVVVLCAGGLERSAVRLLGRARVLSEAEAAALAPANLLLCQKGLGPPAVGLYARDGKVGISAGAAGRRSGPAQHRGVRRAPAGRPVGPAASRSGGWRNRRCSRTDSPAPDQVRRRSGVLDDSLAARACGLPGDRKDGRLAAADPIRLTDPVGRGRSRGGTVYDPWPDRGRRGGGPLHRPDIPGPAVAVPVGRALTARFGPVRGRARLRGRALPVPSPVPARAADTRAHPPPDRSGRPPVSRSSEDRPDTKGSGLTCELVPRSAKRLGLLASGDRVA